MMRTTYFIALVLLAAGLVVFSTHGTTGRPTTRPAVVVELFSSEGCSSCPPADAVLAELSKPDAVDGIDIIPLEFHVDYWNHLGWADPFSSAAFSARQEDYAQALHSQLYTPQMIVNGSEEFVGSDRAKAEIAIKKAADKLAGKLELEISPLTKDARNIECKLTLDPPQSESQLVIAITEEDLSTQVPRGENAGAMLHHAAVVRYLKPIATYSAGGTAPVTTDTKLDILPAWNAQHLNIVAFLQETRTSRIVAAAAQRVMPSK